MASPIDSYARFFQALDASIAYAESAEFLYPALQPGLLAELRAIRAWTAKDRTPRLSERLSCTFAWALFRTRDGGGDEPPEHTSRLDLAKDVVTFFALWPSAAQLPQRGETPTGVPRTPTLDEIRVVLQHIQAAVGTIVHAAIWPLAPAFESKQPLMRDTMTTPQWVRWVLVPRLEDIVDGTTPLPAQSQLTTLARDLANDPATWPLLYTLGELDDLFVTSLEEALRQRRGGAAS
jgi:uncharacterized protein YqcC (DUF446 family)